MLLLGLLQQGVGVVGPEEISRDMGAHNPEGGDSFHTFSIYEDRSVVPFVLPELPRKFFSLEDVQFQVVF